MNKLWILLILILLTPTFGGHIDAVVVDSSYSVSIDNFSEGAVQDDAVGLQSYIQRNVGGAGGQLAPTVGHSSNGNVIQIVSASFRNLSGSNGTANAMSIGGSDESADVAVSDTPLCYPNPFSQSSLTRLQYTLNKNANIDIQVYNLMANLVLKQSYLAGAQGGASGRNVIKVQDMNGSQFSVGAYFIFIVSDGKVLARTKVAVIP